MKRYLLTFSFLSCLVALGALPLRATPNLQEIALYERTSGLAPTEYVFAPFDSRLAYAVGELTAENCDFAGVPDVELYDVYYSNADGSPNMNGEFLSVSCVYPVAWPSAGGCNIAKVELRFEDGRVYTAREVVSYVLGGQNGRRSWIKNAVDDDELTHTTMGGTGEVPRLRLTFRFFEMVTQEDHNPQSRRVCRI